MQSLPLGFILEVQPLLLEAAANVFYFLDWKHAAKNFITFKTYFWQKKKFMIRFMNVELKHLTFTCGHSCSNQIA